ncbi:hypothetical protein KRP22_014108 [Phytophthora ramorum]|nr:hypothetical protein KRP22_9293 [Phytophthora ramorum]
MWLHLADVVLSPKLGITWKRFALETSQVFGRAVLTALLIGEAVGEAQDSCGICLETVLKATEELSMKGSFSTRGNRSASYSPADSSRVQEPSMYHGKMRTAPESSAAVDIILGVAAETIHAITVHQHQVMFQSPIGLVKEIVWDHSEKSVHFVLDDGSTSPTFVFPVLTELETHLSAIVALPDLEKPPEQVYIGVLIGQNLPSPIQQRRASLGSSQPSLLPMSKRRELLRKEQPVRNAVSRERLGVEYMRSGFLGFTCSISGDLRGLTLGIHHMRIFPSPDCHDRSACLFSYGYEHLESCEVAGTRLELRFRSTHQLAKQPSCLVFQSLEAQYIREAIWYLKNGTYMDASLREMLASPARSLVSHTEASEQSSDLGASRGASVLMFFADADSLKQRADACCRVIGCQNLVDCTDLSGSKPDEASASNVMVHINAREPSSLRTNPSTSRVLTSGLCEFHASCLSSTPSELLTRQKPTLSRDKPPLPAKSMQPLTSLLQSVHYAKMFKFQGQLQKRQNARTFHLRKAWHPKLVVLFETPVGGFLCYYDKIAHCPGMTDAPKERRVIDLSSVLCIRPVSAASPVGRNSNASTPVMHSFDVVTLYRTWTFAALEPAEYEVWLHVLTECVEKHATIAPDKVLRFPVKLAMTGQTSPTEATSLEISSHGVSFCTGHEADVVLSTWYYTDLEKWSVVFQQGYTCCLLRCRSPPPASPGSPRAGSGDAIIQDYLFRTTEASVVCLAIEFYVGKCMAKLEILAGQFLEEGRAQKSKTTLVPDPVASKRGTASPKRGLPVVKEHPIENVSLAPIRRSEDTMAAPDVRGEQGEPEALVDATPKQQGSEVVAATLGGADEILETGKEPTATVELKDQRTSADLLLEIEEAAEEHVHDTQTSAKSVPAEWMEEQTLNASFDPATAPDLLPPATTPEAGVEVVFEHPTDTEANNADTSGIKIVESLRVADLDERNSNSDMESIDLLEGEATGQQDGDGLDMAISPASPDGTSQLDACDNTVAGSSLGEAEMIEEDAKMANIPDITDVSCEDIPSFQDQLPPSALESVTPSLLTGWDARDIRDNDMDGVDLLDGAEVIDLQGGNDPVVVPFLVVADDQMQSQVSEVDASVTCSRMDDVELVDHEKEDDVQEPLNVASVLMDRTPPTANGSKPKVSAVASPLRRVAPVSPCATSPKFPPIKKPKQTSPKKAARGLTGKGVSLPQVSSVTFASEIGTQELDSGEELEILKCILVREGYLQRLGRASTAGHIAGAHLGETVDVLDLLRLATLETVEAIAAWRLYKQKSNERNGLRPLPELEQFKWNGLNYLLKLASDLEFLGKHTGLTEWLGFSLQRNPFVLPLNLDCRAKLVADQQPGLQPTDRADTAASDRFLQVGGKRSQSTRDSLRDFKSLGDTDKSASDADALAQLLAERRRAKTPYETRVVNDEELVPNAPPKIGSLRAKSRAPARAAKTNYSSVLPSQIGEVDMARLHDAEVVVLREEAAFGRFTRDIHGRVVPEDEAQRRFSMVELSGNVYKVPAILESSYTAQDPDGNVLRLGDPSHSDLPGRCHAKKRSGMLGPISKPEWRSFDRPPPPRRRARGAQLEEALAAERKANTRLGVLLDSLREGTERKAMDVAYFESCSELQVYGSELHAFTTQAQRELSVLRREFEEKRYLYASKLVNIQKKEEMLNTFKAQHKAAQDATHLERIESSRSEIAKVASLNQEQQRREDQEQAAARAAAVAERLEHDRAEPLVQQFCATQIQKFARGMLAREMFEHMKIEFVVASSFIQAGARGFLVRRRVAKMYWHKAASVHLQRVARGWFARRVAQAKRTRRLREFSAERIQKVVRGRLGRVRMAKIRALVRWRLQLALAARSVTAAALKELATECQEMVALPALMKTEAKSTEGRRSLPALVLGLVRLVMIFTTTNRSDLFGPKQGSEKQEETYREELVRRMVDAEVKLALDRTTRLRLELAEDPVTNEMVGQSTSASPAPNPALVVVMEAVIVLLTPGKVYEGPSQSEIATSSVSWRLSRRLLAQPAFLRAKLQQVDVSTIPPVNLVALERFVRHPRWPNAVVSRSQVHSSRLVHALAAWVESAARTARMIVADGTGFLAPEITRFGPVPGLFERVVVFDNCPTDHAQDGAGEDSSVIQLMDAVLADVRVYRTVQSLVSSHLGASSQHRKKKASEEGERCVVSLFHESRRIFASAYSPSTGQRWLTAISEDEIDSLLTPTAMPLGGQVRADKLPPQSRAEMYARLARLCLLQKRRLEDVPESIEAPSPYELVVRPHAVRLYRHALQLGGYLTTLTIAELARGHVQIDAFVHGSNSQKPLEQAVGLTLAVELENILARLSAAEARRMFVPSARIPSLLLDRLHLYCVTRSPMVVPEFQPGLVSALRLSVRTTATSPGRVLLRRAVRVPGDHQTGASGERWVFTLVERHERGGFEAAFYAPGSSTRHSIPLSRNAAQELLHLSRHTASSELHHALLRSFCFSRPASKVLEDGGSDAAEDAVEQTETMRCYRQRRRIVARFPCVLRIMEDPRQQITRNQLVRAYAQVELCDQEPDGEEGAAQQFAREKAQALHYRLWLPGSCVEQVLILQESELEASLPVELSWQQALPRERRGIARQVVQRYFAWDPNGGGDNGCAVAHLPCGSFWATEVTPVLRTAPSHEDAAMREHHVPAQSDGGESEVAVVSCTRLLDGRDTESDDEEDDPNESVEGSKLQRTRKIYSYDTEELVHHGSYRANGLYVVVRVSMQALVVRDLEPTLASPTDRVRERDSFAIQFHVYHPASSSSAVAAIRGHRDLREVVGPDKPFLIASTCLDSLMKHIILTRLDAQVEQESTTSEKCLQVAFLRDRLYAKQKATPVTKAFERDSSANAAKLIDESRHRGRAGERGVKVLTTAKELPGCGRTLLTVFDVAGHRNGPTQESASCLVLLRVDAYVCATSDTLSLLLEGSDLAHLVGADDRELLSRLTYIDSSVEEVLEVEKKRSRKLASVVLDHLRVEQRSDGRGGRLVLSDYAYSFPEALGHDSKSKRLFKTVRAVGRDQVVLSVYLDKGTSEANSAGFLSTMSS